LADFGHLIAVLAMISDALFALLATGGCLALVLLALLARRLEPARLTAWRERRENKRSVIAQLERQQLEQLVASVEDTTGPGDDEALLRYLQLENNIETAKRISPPAAGEAGEPVDSRMPAEGA